MCAPSPGELLPFEELREKNRAYFRLPILLQLLTIPKKSIAAQNVYCHPPFCFLTLFPKKFSHWDRQTEGGTCGRRAEGAE